MSAPNVRFKRYLLTRVGQSGFAAYDRYAPEGEAIVTPVTTKPIALRAVKALNREYHG